MKLKNLTPKQYKKADKYYQKAKYYHGKMHEEWKRVCGSSVKPFLDQAGKIESSIGVSVSDQISITTSRFSEHRRLLDTIVQVKGINEKPEKINLFCDTKKYKHYDRLCRKYYKKHVEIAYELPPLTK